MKAINDSVLETNDPAGTRKISHSSRSCARNNPESDAVVSDEFRYAKTCSSHHSPKRFDEQPQNKME